MSSSAKRADKTDGAFNPDSSDDSKRHLQGHREVAGPTADFRIAAATTGTLQALDATSPLGSRLLPQSQEWPSEAQRDTDTHQAEGTTSASQGERIPSVGETPSATRLRRNRRRRQRERRAATGQVGTSATAAPVATVAPAATATDVRLLAPGSTNPGGLAPEVWNTFADGLHPDATAMANEVFEMLTREPAEEEEEEEEEEEGPRPRPKRRRRKR